MKYLTNYIEEANSKTFKKYGAFFAFGASQLSEGMKENGHTDKGTLCSMRGGLVCKKTDAKELLLELNKNCARGIEQDKADHSPTSIIKRELSNHEFKVTCDLTATKEALAGYGFTQEQYVRAIQLMNAPETK